MKRGEPGAIGRGAIAALGLLLSTGVLSCRKGGSPLVFPNAPVILISVDTLRADRLPAYGYRGIETPNLDALRKDSILFEHAYSQVPLTLPSHTSLFTGRLPPQNGVRDNIGYRLGPAPETLAGFLKRNGYATGGAVSSIVLAEATGVSRGFDFYSDDIEPTAISQSLGRVQRGGMETVRRLEEWLSGVEERPFLAFLHLFEPHSPYEPPEPYRSRYSSAYDGEIARADEIVGDFLRLLKEKNLYEKSVLFFLSDHGEGLRDHGEEEHGVLLYRESIHVPLFLKLPGSRRGGERVGAPVALTDIFPTIAGLLRLTAPPGLSGISLAEGLGGQAFPSRQIYSETLYPRLHLGWSDLASLVDERHHYIQAPRPEFYDIIADPGEKNDLAEALPPAFRSLRVALNRMERPLQPPGGSDPEQVKRLASLGYISATTSDWAAEDLPDPKDRLEAVDQLKEGFGKLQANRFGEAAKTLKSLLERNPRMTDVWLMLAQAYLKLGRDQEASVALHEAARLLPGHPQVLSALSEYYLETGRYKEAREHAFLAREAGATNPHLLLARIAIAQGDLVAAESAAQEALRETPKGRIPRLILGHIRRERGDLLGALEELEMARRLSREGQPPLGNLDFLRGDVLARLGREREAEAAFREEVASFPFAPAPRTGLALLYASQGREREAREALEALVALKTPEALSAAIRTYQVLGDPDSAAALRTVRHRLFPGARERPEGAG